VNVRALALGATVGLSAMVALGSVVPAEATSNPSIELSTNTLVPGQTVVISGTGWPVFSSVVATLCGADAVSGTADCAVTETATMVATHHGLLYSRFSVVAPPAPCPCVMLLTSDSSNFTKTIPVTVVGQPTAPVRPLRPTPVAKPRISGFKVTGTMTAGSAFGAPAPRTITMQLENPSSTTVKPVLVGRWGRSGHATTVIPMPHLGALQPAQRVTVRVPFDLTALSVGSYVVRVEVQLVGSPNPLVATTTTSQWPVALFVAVALLIAAVIVGFVIRRRQRRDTEEEGKPGTAESAVEDAAAASVAADGRAATSNESTEVDGSVEEATDSGSPSDVEPVSAE
jgi:hypothetical protein